MTIAVTGASGFVGTYLLPFLKEKGHDMYAINLREKSSIFSLIEAEGIMHLAGIAHDHKGKATREDYFKINFELTKEVFQVFLKSKARYFIHFSTVAAVSDELFDGIMTEDAQPHPTAAYGQSKLAAEEYLLAQKLPNSKKLFIIRPAMIHGPGDKGNLRLLYKMVETRIPYPLGAFKNLRSFLGIDNLCFILGKLIDQSNFIPSGIYNVVDDDPLSTLTVIQYIGLVLKRTPIVWSISPKLVRVLAKLGDILTFFPFNSKRMRKMTESYIVSNAKIKTVLNVAHLPFSASNNMKKTIQSLYQESD